MANTHDNQTTRIANRHYSRVVAVVVLVCSIIGIVFMFRGDKLDQNMHDDETRSEAIATTTSVYYTRALPTELIIPKLSLTAPFTDTLRLNEDQTIEVPKVYDKVGWYEFGPSPGEKGPAVILGHVDSYQGPAIFYSLGKLATGDQIEVARADGTRVTFIVYALERYEQAQFPRERVYGMTEGSELRLITCTGTFDRGKQRYSHNLVVYARLAQAPVVY